MTEEDLKKAKQLGYARGYVAGQRKLKKDRQHENRAKEREAFRRRVFLAALPFAMEQSQWKRNDQLIQTIEERVDLAVDVANAALKRFFF